jgi:hypothetical protein
MMILNSQRCPKRSTEEGPVQSTDLGRGQNYSRHQVIDEPQLPEGYRHVRSLLEALLAWAEESPMYGLS